MRGDSLPVRIDVPVDFGQGVLPLHSGNLELFDCLLSLLNMVLIIVELLVCARLLDLKISEHFQQILQLGIVLGSGSGVHLLLQYLQSVILRNARHNHSLIHYDSLVIRIVVRCVQYYQLSNQNLLLNLWILISKHHVS